MKKFYAVNCKLPIKIDDADYEKVKKLKWRFTKSGNLIANIKRKDEWTTTGFSQVIGLTKDGDQHYYPKDGNFLNLQRKNLLWPHVLMEEKLTFFKKNITRVNRRHGHGGELGKYPNVTYDKKCGRWVLRLGRQEARDLKIRSNGTPHYLGYAYSEESANNLRLICLSYIKEFGYREFQMNRKELIYG